MLYSQVLDFLFIFFMIFLFLNHLREDSLNGVFYHILVVVWLKLSCCCCSDGLAVLTRIVLVHGWLIYDAFDDALIFNASQKRFVPEVLLLIDCIVSPPGHKQVLLLLDDRRKRFVNLISTLLHQRLPDFFIVRLILLHERDTLRFSRRHQLIPLHLRQINLKLLLQRPSSLSSLLLLIHRFNQLLVLCTYVFILLTEFLVLVSHHVYQIYFFLL